MSTPVNKEEYTAWERSVINHFEKGDPDLINFMPPTGEGLPDPDPIPIRHKPKKVFTNSNRIFVTFVDANTGVSEWEKVTTLAEAKELGEEPDSDLFLRKPIKYSFEKYDWRDNRVPDEMARGIKEDKGKYLYRFPGLDAGGPSNASVKDGDSSHSHEERLLEEYDPYNYNSDDAEKQRVNGIVGGAWNCMDGMNQEIGFKTLESFLISMNDEAIARGFRVRLYVQPKEHNQRRILYSYDDIIAEVGKYMVKTRGDDDYALEWTNAEDLAREVENGLYLAIVWSKRLNDYRITENINDNNIYCEHLSAARESEARASGDARLRQNMEDYANDIQRSRMEGYSSGQYGGSKRNNRKSKRRKSKRRKSMKRRKSKKSKRKTRRKKR